MHDVSINVIFLVETACDVRWAAFIFRCGAEGHAIRHTAPGRVREWKRACNVRRLSYISNTAKLLSFTRTTEPHPTRCVCPLQGQADTPHKHAHFDAIPFRRLPTVIPLQRRWIRSIGEGWAIGTEKDEEEYGRRLTRTDTNRRRYMDGYWRTRIDGRNHGHGQGYGRTQT